MEAEVIVAYVVCDDTIKNLKIREDKQTTMGIAEVMTTSIVSAIMFSGNMEKARRTLKSKRYFPNMLSKSQFNRRLYKVPEKAWTAVSKVLFFELNKENLDLEFVVDSCPISASKLARSSRSKRYKNKEFFGYCAAQKEYFFGVKLHMICNIKGVPFQIYLSPGSHNDIRALKEMNLDLPKNSIIYGDKGYNDYKYEDQLVQEKQLHFLPIRKKNSKKIKSFYSALRRKKRKIIETAFSCIERLMPRSIHSVTRIGFELKIMLFVLGYTFNHMISKVTT